MTDTTVALLGTGTMGAGMARNIAAAGIPLRVWNRTVERARPLADVGATVAGPAGEGAPGRAGVPPWSFAPRRGGPPFTGVPAGPAEGPAGWRQRAGGAEGTNSRPK